MAVILNETLEYYCIYCVLDVASCEMFTVRTPHIGNPTCDCLTVCRSTSC